MGIKDLLQGFYNELRKANPDIPEEKFNTMWSQVEKGVNDEPPPKIALIGEAGVGKSSTINALFNAGAEVSHIKAWTQKADAFTISMETVGGDKGVLIIYDMPGLGESMESQGRHLATYDKTLQEVDVALWILDAQYRAMESIQRSLTTKIKPMNPDLVDRMVIAVNKVDLVHPGEKAWHPLANLPSEEQENNIKARLYDIQKHIRAVLPSWRGDIIGYSAYKRYNLPQLFLSMLDAVPKKRQWMLTSRKALADFLELVDPRLIPEDLQPALKKSKHSPEKMIASILDDMSEEELADITGSRTSLASFIKKVTGRS